MQDTYRSAPALRPPVSHPSSTARSEEPWDVLALHRQSVVRFLKRKCRDVHQAEDLAHDTLIKAARYGEALHRVARPGAWVIQIAANIQRDFMRRESRQRLLPPEDELFRSIGGTEPIPGDGEEEPTYEVDGRAFGQSELVAEIGALWDGMSTKDRTVISGYYREGGSSDLAAANCGIDRGLVKIRLFRARRRLETRLRQRLCSA